VTAPERTAPHPTRRPSPLRTFAATVAAALAFLAVSCSPGGTPPLRVGIPPWAPAQFAFVARDLGLLRGKIDLVQYGSPIELSRHFREGSLDAAVLTLDFVPYWSASIPTLDVVFVVDVSRGADGVVANADITTLAGLRGRRIGVEASPLGAHLLLRALTAGGLSARDVEVVSVDSEEQADALLARRVDAVVTNEPDRSRLLSGGAVSLFDSTQIPGQIVDVLVVPTALAAERQEDLRALIDGWLAAFARLQDDHAATVATLASGMSVDAAIVERALAGARFGDIELNREMLGGPTPRLAATLKEIQGLAVGGGLMPGDSRGRVRFDDSLLPSIVTRSIGQASGAGAR